MKNCYQAKKLTKLMAMFDLNDRTKFKNNYINPLLNEQLLKLTIPEKPNSPNQKYVLTEKGSNLLTHITYTFDSLRTSHY